ncbi:MAG: hypothetical protein IJL70_05390 [Treponema sp.]|nr:hypothetical protein [Treponema sp.]
MLKKFLITGGIGLAAYVINEVRKEYDKNVEDYNNLLDKYNDLCDYKYNKSPNSGKRYIKETQVMPDGSTQTITKDAATGFSVVSNNRA